LSAKRLRQNGEKGTAKNYTADAFEILDHIEHPMAEAIHKFIAEDKSPRKAC